MPLLCCAVLCRTLSGLAALNCLQQQLMEAAAPRLLKHLRFGTVDVQVCVAAGLDLLTQHKAQRP